MRVKRSYRWLKIFSLVFAALIMLLLCHAAYSPYTILPQQLRYSLLPVSEISYLPPLEPGDLAVCDKAAALSPGAIVACRPHMLSSLALPAGGYFGDVISFEQSGSVHDAYTVKFRYGGEELSLLSQRPELVIYRVSGVGGAILLLHEYQYFVFTAFCLYILAVTLYFVLTRKRRKLKVVREEYIKMFEQYADKFEASEEDY